MRDSRLIAVGGLSSLTREDKELSLCSTVLLQLSYRGVAIS